jgi:hypothetical protein
MNQCDGCRRGLPVENGLHRGAGYDLIHCTRALYEQMKPAIHCADCSVLVDEDYATAPLPTTQPDWEDLADEHARAAPWIKRVARKRRTMTARKNWASVGTTRRNWRSGYGYGS